MQGEPRRRLGDIAGAWRQGGGSQCLANHEVARDIFQDGLIQTELRSMI
jgi:hypothetical protein